MEIAYPHRDFCSFIFKKLLKRHYPVIRMNKVAAVETGGYLNQETKDDVSENLQN
jgi:hypothetical protein